MGDSGNADDGSKNRKNGDNPTNTVDYWTRAMVQNMKEEALLDRKIGKIEKEHSQIIIQMTYTHRQLTDRLKLVNWYHEKKKERERESRSSSDTSSSSGGSSQNSLDFRDFKSELREYWEWKERAEMRRGKKHKPTLEPELRERMKLEMNSLRRPQPPILPPLIKPSFMYRQWKRKNKKLIRANPKYLLEKKKMYLIAEDAEEKQRRAQANQDKSNRGKSTATKNSQGEIQLKRQQVPAGKALNFNTENNKGRLPTLEENDMDESDTEVDGIRRSTVVAAGGSARRFSGHKTAALFKTRAEGSQSLAIPRPASSTETVTVIPLTPSKDSNHGLNVIRATTSIT